MKFREFDLIPLHINEKRPYGDDWLNRKWTSEELESFEFFGHNFGVRLREIDLVVDFDIKHLDPNVNPEKFVMEFLFNFGIAEALTVKTPSGGYHVYLKKDPTLKIKRYLPEYGKAIEFKTSGTQVVAPGSTVDGKTYRIVTDGPQLLCPYDLAQLLKKELKGEAAQEILPIESISKLLNLLPAEDCQDYDTWLKIGQAVHSGTNGSEEGRELFLNWSQKDPKYSNDNSASQKWDSFSAGGSINVHYIKKVMKDLGIPLPRPTALEDFADISLDFMPEYDSPPKPDYISNYKEIIGGGVSEERRKKIYEKHLKKIEPEADFEARMKDLPEKKVEAERKKRETKISNAALKIEADLSEAEEDALKPRIEYKSPGEIFREIDQSFVGREWGVFGDKVVVLTEDGSNIIQRHPKGIVNIMGDVGVEPRWLSRTSEGTFLVNKEEFGNYLIETPHSRDLRAVSDKPCWPLADKTIYYGPARSWHKEPCLEKGKLDEFLDFFRPATHFDRKLMKAFFLTLLWNEPGCKPGFAILSTGKTLAEKKTTGKSRFLQLMNEMAAGQAGIKLNHKQGSDPFENQIPNVIQNSASRSFPNLFVLDNYDENSVLPHDFNEWAEASEITVRAMYKGTMTLRNAFTFAMSSNAPSLTGDLSNRFIAIYLNKPEATVDRAEWEKRVSSFIKEHRESVVKEALEILKAEPTDHIRNYVRFARWQTDVLGKVISEDEWEQLKTAVTEHKAKGNSEINQDIEIFEEFDDYITDYLEAASIDFDKFGTLILKKGFLKNVAKLFAVRYRERGINHKYIVENVAEYSNLMSVKDRITRGPAKGQREVILLKGLGEGTRYLDANIYDKSMSKFGLLSRFKESPDIDTELELVGK